MSDLIASRVADCVPPAVSRTIQKARALEAQGKKLTYLMRGEPDFATPPHIVNAAVKALSAGQTHYGPTQGIPELRAAIARRMMRDFGVVVDPERQILVTNGATMGIYVAVMAVINPGDEVLLFDPVYDPYPTIVRLAGGKPVRLEIAPDEKQHFRLTREVIEGAVTPRTKAILLNNPWNPTGTVLTEQELQLLADAAEEHNLVLIVDEIYEKLTFGGRVHHSLAALSPVAAKRTITINSFSKTYAMTGWRLGYNIASPELTKAMVGIAEQFSRSAATFVQYAGLEALDGPQDVVTSMMDTYARRRELVAGKLLRANLFPYAPPEGTFFTLLDIRRFERDSESMADYLMQEANVVTIPGSAYGEAGEGYLRLSFAYDEQALERGTDALLEGLERL